MAEGSKPCTLEDPRQQRHAAVYAILTRSRSRAAATTPGRCPTKAGSVALSTAAHQHTTADTPAAGTDVLPWTEAYMVLSMCYIAHHPVVASIARLQLQAFILY